MKIDKLSYRPTLDREETRVRLGQLLIRGTIDDRDLASRIDRIEERFRVYTACSPFGLWAPGLVVTGAMRGVCEAYLPLAEIRHAFRRLITLSLRFTPSFVVSAVHIATTWLDVLDTLPSSVTEANPAHLLRRLMIDGEFRSRFLFALFLPSRYGGGFGRYPGQAAFLRNWLAKTAPTGPLCCLDAACGSGEGSYELALLLLERGYAPDDLAVFGTTLEPLELFAAAHGWFPHDAARQTAFRSRIRRIFADRVSERIIFTREDLTEAGCSAAQNCDIILCNGLLGGPLLHEREQLAGTIGRLCARLRLGGIMLAANRFHGGWKRLMPDQALREMLAGNGLKVLAVDEGVAGVKQ
jgi:chemotaxis methyl-accepting protein methylase